MHPVRFFPDIGRIPNRQTTQPEKRLRFRSDGDRLELTVLQNEIPSAIEPPVTSKSIRAQEPSKQFKVPGQLSEKLAPLAAWWSCKIDRYVLKLKTPDDKIDYYGIRRAKQLTDAGDLIGALASVERATQLVVGRARPQLLLGQLTRHYAEDMAKVAVEMSVTGTIAYQHGLERLLPLQNRMVRIAARAFHEAYKLNGSDRTPLLETQMMLDNLRQWQPQKSSHWAATGECYKRWHRDDEGILAYQKALELGVSETLDPKVQASWHFTLGEIYQRNIRPDVPQNRALALQSYQTSEGLNPHDERAVMKMALHFIGKGEKGEAMRRMQLLEQLVEDPAAELTVPRKAVGNFIHQYKRFAR